MDLSVWCQPRARAITLPSAWHLMVPQITHHLPSCHSGLHPLFYSQFWVLVYCEHHKSPDLSYRVTSVLLKASTSSPLWILNLHMLSLLVLNSWVPHSTWLGVNL